MAIEDTGVSILKEELPSLFCYFLQVEEAYTWQLDCTGLGLSIIQHLITLMGGAIWVEPEQDKGSCFGLQMTLPKSGSAEAFIPPRPTALHCALVVDDNPVIRSILPKQLIILALMSSVSPVAPPLRHNLSQYLIWFSTEAIRTASHRMPIVLLISNLNHAEYYPARDVMLSVLQKPFPRSVLLDRLSASTLTADRGFPLQPQLPTMTQIIGIGRQFCALAAEDNKTNRLALQRMSKKLSIEPKFVTDGRQVVEVCAGFQPVLILMNISMLGMEGKEATKRTWKSEAQTGKHVPILALTAHPSLRDSELVSDSGWEGYIINSLSKKMLLKYL